MQLQDKNDLVLAKNARTEAGSRGVVHRLKCQPQSGSWRCLASGQQGVDKISLQSWLMPPEEARITL